MSLPFSVDPKPAAAFIEYTLKPLLDNARELVVILEQHGLRMKDLKLALIMFILERLLASFTAITVTGLICYTAFSILHLKV